MKIMIACAILAFLGCGLRLLAAGDATAGKAIFDSKCKICHGAKGEGNPAVAKTLKTEIQPLDAKEVQAKSDDEMKKQIAQGGIKMKAIPGLSDKQIQDVIAFVRSLAKS